jgi:hypothetical protein
LETFKLLEVLVLFLIRPRSFGDVCGWAQSREGSQILSLWGYDPMVVGFTNEKNENKNEADLNSVYNNFMHKNLLMLD